MDRHGPLMDRITGQIWDSAAGVSAIPRATAKSITDNMILQTAIWTCLELVILNFSSYFSLDICSLRKAID